VGSLARKSLTTAAAAEQATTRRNKRRESIDASAMAREYAHDAVAALVRGLRDPKQYVAAANSLLDRGFGKPAMTVHAEHNVSVLHLIAAQALGIELQQSIQTDVATPTIEAQPDADALPKE